LSDLNYVAKAVFDLICFVEFKLLALIWCKSIKHNSKHTHQTLDFNIWVVRYELYNNIQVYKV